MTVLQDEKFEEEVCEKEQDKATPIDSNCDRQFKSYRSFFFRGLFYQAFLRVGLSNNFTHNLNIGQKCKIV